MSALLDKWLVPHGCPKAATPANSATPRPEPAKTLGEMGSNPSATPCYPAPESAEGSSKVATTLLPKNASKQAASAAEVAKVAGVAGYRRTHPKVAPPEGSTAARIVAAGGVSRIGGHRPDRTLYRVAELPEDAPAELVAELERERWHVARILKAARRVTPRPEDDPGEWRGEYEAPEPAMAVRYWRHGEVRGAPSSALVPHGPLFDAADWLNDYGHGPVAIIEEQP